MGGIMLQNNAYRIVVIDDNPAIFQDFRKILDPVQTEKQTETEQILFGKTPSLSTQKEQLKLDLVSYTNGIDGHKAIIDAYKANNPFCVAFVDVRMPPGWDGIKTIQSFWDADPDIQVVICSAHSDYNWTDIHNSFGLSDRLLILKKPFEYSEVKQMANTLAHKWSLSKELKEHAYNLEKLVQKRTAELQTILSISTATLESSKDGILVLDRQGHIINNNNRFTDMWKIPGTLSKRMTLQSIEKHINTIAKTPGNYIASPFEKIGAILEIILKQGDIFALSFHEYVIDDKIEGILICCTDITKRKMIEKILTYEATHDYLTGLPNRVLLVDRLKQSLAVLERSNRAVGIILFDLDRFKYINDTLGHSIGDGLLQGIAARITGVLRKGDSVSRLGGDEFVVIVNDFEDPEDLINFAHRIQESISDPFIIADHTIKITCSIGMSMAPLHGRDPDILLSSADTALYSAKDISRGSYCFYTQGMSDNSLKKAELEIELKYALERNELSLLYQPIVDARTGKICGVESLLRWHHPKFGNIPPADFIPLAENSGEIIKIGDWILETVNNQINLWQSTGINLFVTINISGVQLKNSDFLDRFYKLISNTPHASLFEIELTESILLDRSSHVLTALETLKSLGLKISLDDFGTGYSSLTYLRRFPVDKIKIEKAFITEITTEKESQAIVSAIIAMAHKLNISVVAEGIEQENTIKFLKDLSCDYFQGYYFSQAVSPESIAELYTKHQLPEIKESSSAPLLGTTPTHRRIKSHD